MAELEKAPSDEATPPPSGRFVKVARVRDIPLGGTYRVEIGIRLVCLANVDSHIYAVSDDCPHIGGALSEGELAGCVLTCPVHLAQFDVRSGRVLRGPAREDVPAYAVRVVGEDVYVSAPDEQGKYEDEIRG
jgi:3-phenylpropionate/trans-cinnamate dioxygenase ferredoxin subunit